MSPVLSVVPPVNETVSTATVGVSTALECAEAARALLRATGQWKGSEKHLSSRCFLGARKFIVVLFVSRLTTAPKRPSTQHMSSAPFPDGLLLAPLKKMFLRIVMRLTEPPKPPAAALQTFRVL